MLLFVIFFLFRRNYYTFDWKLDRQLCPYVTPGNLHSVKYVYVCGIEPNHNRSNYFPNAIQLTIEQNFQTFDHPLNELLNRIAPLNNITKLIIKNFQLYFEQLLQILCSTSSLTTVKIDYLCIDNFEQILFRTVSFLFFMLCDIIPFFDVISFDHHIIFLLLFSFPWTRVMIYMRVFLFS